MRKVVFLFVLILSSTLYCSSVLAKPMIKQTKHIELLNEKSFNNDYKINTVLSPNDICTVTVSIYINGRLASRASYTDHTGDCELAAAGATMLAEWALRE